jgi:hypothetical protein
VQDTLKDLTSMAEYYERESLWPTKTDLIRKVLLDGEKHNPPVSPDMVNFFWQGNVKESSSY